MKKMRSVLEHERSFITMTLIRLYYLVHDLNNYADNTSTEIDLWSISMSVIAYAMIMQGW